MSNENYDLKELKAAVNNACEAAILVGDKVSGPVNWGDLSCASARKTIDDEDIIEYEVLIEEAAPNAYKLQVFIMEHLSFKGYENIVVKTEW